MQLSLATIKYLDHKEGNIPDDKRISHPEKILQFGTGRLLRGLPDYYVDKANKMGIFNGSIVAVKSTNKGDVKAYKTQDNLYTLCERELRGEKLIERNTICSTISRVIVAQEEWSQVLACAHNKELQIIISNTTEVGIQFLADDMINANPPKSYPGKLLAFLYERYKAFGGSRQSGMVIIPTELITNNGRELQTIVIKLAQQNNLEPNFIEWLIGSNSFCNSLVDRIVSVPTSSAMQVWEKDLGYRDDLITITEVYSLWAIEGDDSVKVMLPFYKADKGIIIQPDIDMYRELKLRLLNGTHTLTCGVAFLAGYDTVQQTMEDRITESFISDLMHHEIAPAIPYKIDQETVAEYAANVLNRFRNPYIHHYWKNITLNYSSKIRMRCIPLLLNYMNILNTVPPLFALSFAAYLWFMKAVKKKNEDYFGLHQGEPYLIEDEKANEFYSLWQNNSPEVLVGKVLKNEILWGSDLTLLSGFQQAVTDNLNSIAKIGMKETIKNIYRY